MYFNLLEAGEELKDFQLEPCRSEVSLVCNHTLTNGVNLALLQCENDLPQASCLINLPSCVRLLSFINLLACLPCTEQVTDHRKFCRYYAQAVIVYARDETVTLNM